MDELLSSYVLDTKRLFHANLYFPRRESRFVEWMQGLFSAVRYHRLHVERLRVRTVAEKMISEAEATEFLGTSVCELNRKMEERPAEESAANTP